MAEVLTIRAIHSQVMVGEDRYTSVRIKNIFMEFPNDTLSLMTL